MTPGCWTSEMNAARLRKLYASAVVAAVATTGASCSSDDSVSSRNVTTSVTVATGIEPAPSTTSTAPGGIVTIEPSLPDTTASGRAASTDIGDYDGATFDFGGITGATSTGGVVSIEFDRYQLYGDALDATGEPVLKSGKDFTEEPIVYGNTDVPYKNDSNKLRRFVLSPDVRLLQIQQPAPCASDEFMAAPIWNTITMDQLLGGAWKVGGEDSLTFGTDGLVSQVRLSSAC